MCAPVLWIPRGSALFALLVGLLGACVGARTSPGLVLSAGVQEPLTVERPAMGTIFRIVVWGQKGSGRAAAIEAAFEEIAELERVLTDYDSQSEARQATGHGTEWVAISPLLAQALQHGRLLALQTNGLVDPTVGPLTRLWRRSARQGTLPDPGLLSAALERVGFEFLELKTAPDHLRCLKKGMRLDFGAYGKGLAVDQAFELLRARGFNSILVDGGGDLRVGAAPPGKSGWLVRLEARRGDGAQIAIQERALATSGNRFQTVRIEGSSHGHIIDPRTGLGISTSRGVTVAADTACAADGWATALCIVGGEGLARLPAGMGARLVEGKVRDGLREVRFPGKNSSSQGPEEFQ